VFPLGRQRVILGDHRPAVRQQAHEALAGVDHRLDREGHAGAQLEARAGLAVVQHLRVLVVDAADAVAAVFPHDRETPLLGIGLHGVPDVAEVGARAHLLDAAPHRLEAGLDQALGLDRGLADEVHPAGVAVVAVPDHGDVDVDDVPGLQALVVRDAVADDVVHRGADGLREAPVVQVGGHRLLHPDDVVVAEPVEFLGRDPGHHVLADHVQDVGRQAPGFAHFLLFFRGFDRYEHAQEGLGEWVP
jgi:hypothetical protein